MKMCNMTEHWWQIRQYGSRFFITYNVGRCHTSRIVGMSYGVDGFLYIHTRDNVCRVDKNKCICSIDFTHLKAHFPEL